MHTLQNHTPPARSLNLSHAVGVVLSDLFERRLEALGLEELPVGQDVTGQHEHETTGTVDNCVTRSHSSCYVGFG
jgi:hypothetical protein